MLEVINRHINRRAPGSPVRRAGWRGPGHLGSFREGVATVQRPAPHLLPPQTPPCPCPVVCEAFAGTLDIIHIKRVDAARTQAAVPAAQLLISFKKGQKRAQEAASFSLSCPEADTRAFTTPQQPVYNLSL